MVPRVDYAQLTPLVFNSTVPTPVKLEVHFETAASAVKIHLDAINADLMLSPDPIGTVFTTTLPIQAFNGLTNDDVNRKFLGTLKVRLASETRQSYMFGDVLTPLVPEVSVLKVAVDVQYSNHLVNIHFPSLPDAGDPFQQLGAIGHKFYTHFEDEYDFLQIVIARSGFSNRYHFQTRADAEGIGVQVFNNTAKYGSARRLMGISVFPIATMFDGANPAAMHELGHQWINYLAIPTKSSLADFRPCRRSHGSQHWHRHGRSRFQFRSSAARRRRLQNGAEQ